MGSAGSRWNRLYRILDIRFGPGAAKLPSSLKRIHLEFAKPEERHKEISKFWRECLPRLKFHNPGISMVVNRDPSEQVKAQMTLYFKDKNAAPVEGATPRPPYLMSSAKGEAKAQPPQADERVVHLALDEVPCEEIVNKLLTATEAQPVLPSAEEQQSMKIFKQIDVHEAADTAQPRGTRLKATEGDKEKETAMPAAS